MNKAKSKFKGWFGEKMTGIAIFLSLNKKIYQRFHDVIINTPDGTTQLDHIIISPYGIFVIETKNMKGWIFGSEKDAKWTQSLSRGRKKYTFQNPLRQNYRHTKSLSEFLGLDHDVMHSIVFFIGECKLKTRMPKNVMASGVRGYIKSFKQVILSDEQIQDAVTKISELKADKSLNTRAHLESLKKRHSEKKMNRSYDKPINTLSLKTLFKKKKVTCSNANCSFKGYPVHSVTDKRKMGCGFLLMSLSTLFLLKLMVDSEAEKAFPSLSSYLFAALVFFGIGLFGYRFFLKSANSLVCPMCSQSIAQGKVRKKVVPISKKPKKVNPSHSKKLFIYLNAEVHGPYTDEQIVPMIETGTITDETKVCPEGSEKWVPYKAYRDFL